MMKIKLLADYRGVLTNEVFYEAGEHDLPDGLGAALVNAGRAEPVEDVRVVIDLSQLTKAELVSYAKEHGITVRSNWAKATILKKLDNGS